MILWDARGHGESDPAPPCGGYGYGDQVEDLDAVIEASGETGRIVVGGHSMGCHTAAAWALANPDRIDALILIGPVFTGREGQADGDRWDARADALAEGGPDEFARTVEAEFTGGDEGRKLVGRLALQRARRHRSPEAVAEALRQVPRSEPFEDLESLSAIEAPTLVVGSRDEIDSGHPIAVAEAWAEVIQNAEFVVEPPGDSPLAWQGGRLSRAINEFLDRRTTRREASRAAG